MARKKEIYGFLRFYGQPRDVIDKCIEELKPYLIGFTKATFHPLTKSMNMFIPTDNNTEVHLHFDTQENLEAFYHNPDTLAIYNKYSSSIGSQGAVLRKPKDIAFS